ncbi:MAG TPA: hypothetical protein VGR02_14365 [Thermoanaerobaculia bacterium]|nr:hypothetical protein [Thermoanaerobaculia bacterium]
MHRSIGALTHGIIDYAMVIFLFAGPSVARFNGKQATICYALAVVHLLLTLVTRFPLGVMKILGFPLHGAVEMMVGLLLLILPWLASFSAGIRSRNFFVAIGLLVLLIWFLTDYRGLRVAGRASGPKPAAR